jgi:hypothetical protein
LSDAGKDEGAAALAATTRFETALAKIDKLTDDDDSVGAKRKRDTTLLEEARRNAARAKLVAIMAHLTDVLVARLSAIGAASRSAPSTSAVADDEDSAEEKLAKRQKLMLEKRLPRPRFGWLDAASKIHQMDHDRNIVFETTFNYFLQAAGLHEGASDAVAFGSGECVGKEVRC